MSLEVSTEMSPAAAAQDPPVRRPFAPPSRAGLLVCAASLMPAYLFGLMGLVSIFTLISLFQAGPGDDPRGPAAGWLHLGHQALTTTFTVLICWLFLIRRPSAQPRGAGGRFADTAAIAGTVVVLGISHAPKTVEDLVVIASAE